MNNINVNLLEKCFEEFEKVEGISYSIFDTDDYGDCSTCVNYEICRQYGKDSKGIFLKFWTEGMNADSFDKTDRVFIAHDITEAQAENIYKIFGKYFEVYPQQYNRTECFELVNKD